MNIETFGYKGEFVFTAPTITSNSTDELLVFATPYGSRVDLDEALSEFLNEFERRSSDLDSTSPYLKLTCFNDFENLLYTSVQFLNDFIFSNFNKEKISLGCDFFCVLKKGDHIYFTQIGFPLLALKVENEFIPISSDYSFKPKEPNLSPYIPTSILGTESTVNIKVQQLKIDSDSKLFIVKSNESPLKFLREETSSLKEVAEIFTEKNPNQGLWLSKITF